MSIPENLATALASKMSAAGHEISDQLHDALEAELAAALEEDQEEGNFTSLETLLGALEYAAHHAYIARSSQ